MINGVAAYIYIQYIMILFNIMENLKGFSLNYDFIYFSWLINGSSLCKIIRIVVISKFILKILLKRASSSWDLIEINTRSEKIVVGLSQSNAAQGLSCVKANSMSIYTENCIWELNL